MKVHELRPSEGAKRPRKRVGCGTGSGLGKTSGRGEKGQGARSGGGVRPGFEGGQTPIYRRLPRRGFTNARFATRYETVNIKDLARFSAGSTVTSATVKEAGMTSGKWRLKVLGKGDLSHALTVVAHAFSATAREKITAAGGTCETIELTRKNTNTTAYQRAQAAAEASAETVEEAAPAQAAVEEDVRNDASDASEDKTAAEETTPDNPSA